MRKTFVLDTNVLLHSAEALESFAEHKVVIPMAVIEELDHFKTRQDELGRNARRVIRRLDALRERGRLWQGVELDTGGEIQVQTVLLDTLPPSLDLERPDNQILAVAWQILEAGEQVIFVSKDINARIKADALGLEVQDFERQRIKFDELYTGHREVEVDGELIEEFYGAEAIPAPEGEFFPNEFLTLRDREDARHTALARVVDGDTLVHLNSRYDRAWNIGARSKEQRLALELLLDPEVQLVTIVGQAGTGKTLLALAAALEATLKYRRYDRILVSRPIVPLGKDIGYLPGAKDEKLFHWMQPIFDNLHYLMRDDRAESVNSTQQKINQLQKDDLLVLEAITYIRGRNIPRQFVIVDEAQNLTPHEVKTIISRAGEGTKMVLTGDPYQIDNPYLDSSTNGLTYTAERLKGQALHGHVTLTKSERSALAAVAARYL